MRAPAALTRSGDGQGLGFAFHRTGAGDDHEMPPAQVQAGQVDDGVFPLHFPAHQLVGPGDRNGLDHPGHIHEQGRIHRTGIAQDGDGHPLPAGHGLGLEAQGLDLGHHRLDLGVGGVLVHYDEHGYSPLSATVKMRMPGPATMVG